MLRAARFPEWHDLAGKNARETASMLRIVESNLILNGFELKKLNPPNGWGSYEGAIEFIHNLANDCEEHPDEEIGAWL